MNLLLNGNNINVDMVMGKSISVDNIVIDNTVSILTAEQLTNIQNIINNYFNKIRKESIGYRHSVVVAEKKNYDGNTYLGFLLNHSVVILNYIVDNDCNINITEYCTINELNVKKRYRVKSGNLIKFFNNEKLDLNSNLLIELYNDNNFKTVVLLSLIHI